MTQPTNPNMPRTSYCVFSMHPAPYRDPLHAKLLSNGEIDCTVVHFYPMDRGHREWKLDSPERLHVKYLSNDDRFTTAKKIISAIRVIMLKNYAAVVVPGYSNPISMAIIVQCTIFRIPFIIDIDSINSGQSAKIYQGVKRVVFKFASGIWVPGKASQKYFSKIQYKRPIAHGSYCLDHDAIASLHKVERAKRTDTSKRLSIPQGTRIFLSVAKFTKNRNFPALVRGFNQLDANLNAHLLIVGYGPDESEVQGEISKNPSRTTHIVSLPFDELKSIYGVADFYIHAGEEPYSTACEYAAHCSIPIICGSGVGFWHDLKDNLASIDLERKTSTANIYQVLCETLKDDFPYNEYAKRAFDVAMKQTPENAARRLIALLTKTQIPAE